MIGVGLDRCKPVVYVAVVELLDCASLLPVPVIHKSKD